MVRAEETTLRTAFSTLHARHLPRTFLQPAILGERLDCVQVRVPDPLRARAVAAASTAEPEPEAAGGAGATPGAEPEAVAESGGSLQELSTLCARLQLENERLRAELEDARREGGPCDIPQHTRILIALSSWYWGVFRVSSPFRVDVPIGTHIS